MNRSTTAGRAALGFVAGALSVATFFFAAWWTLRTAGIIPATAPPVWAMDPRVPPLGVPRALNLIFWGGVWGLVLNLAFSSLRGTAWWLAWMLAGAIAVAGVAIFVVPAIKGLPIDNLTPQRFLLSGLINGIYGLGAAVWLRLIGGAPR